MSRSELLARFARRFQIARKSLGYSQAELGIQMGLSEGVASTRINRYELAVSPASMETAERIAQALGLTLSALLAEDDDLALLITAFVKLGTAEQRHAAVEALLDALPEGEDEEAIDRTLEREAAEERKLARERAKKERNAAKIRGDTGKAAAGNQIGSRQLGRQLGQLPPKKSLDPSGVGDE